MIIRLRNIKRSIYIKVKITRSLIIINMGREKFLVKNLIKRSNYIIK